MNQQLKNQIEDVILVCTSKRRRVSHRACAKEAAELILPLVLKALETPTPEMVEAGFDEMYEQIKHTQQPDPLFIFRAMIRAAQEQGDGFL